MSAIEITISGSRIAVERGAALRDVADAHATPLVFSCREGACGTCLVVVTAGAEQLSPPTSEEEILLPLLAEGRSGCRLACQLRVLGPAAIEPAE